MKENVKYSMANSSRNYPQIVEVLKREEKEKGEEWLVDAIKLRTSSTFEGRLLHKFKWPKEY